MNSPTGSNREQRRAQARDRRRRAAGAALTASTAALGATAMLVAGGAAPAGAATFAVTTNADSGAGSLRQAIIDANNNPGADVITFDASVTSPIVLASDLDVVEDDVDIQGPGASSLTVDANGYNAFQFEFTTSSISGLTVTNGNSDGTFGDDSGGAIALYGGSLSVTGMVLTGNYAQNDGGGAWCIAGDSSDNAVLTITDSAIVGNEAHYGGGGLYTNDCDLTVISSTISGNSAGDDGGGLYAIGRSGTSVIRNTTISDNSASHGGGISLYNATVDVTNSTISGNTATDGEGGAIYSFYGATNLAQVTITDNHAETIGGIAFVGEIDPRAADAGRGERDGASAAAAGPNEAGASGVILAGNDGFDAGGNGTLATTASIIGSVDDLVTWNDNGGNQVGVDPLLGPLASNGGPTQTHALLAGSPAIDKGPNPVAMFPLNENDQRGAGFPRVVNGTVDVGAFEVQAPEPIDIAPRFTG